MPRKPTPRTGGKRATRRRTISVNPDAARLAAENFRLVPFVVNRWFANAREKDELVSVGNLALIQAARNYDPARGGFANYAVECVRGKILQSLDPKRRGPSVRATPLSVLTRGYGRYSRDEDGNGFEPAARPETPAPRRPPVGYLRHCSRRNRIVLWAYYGLGMTMAEIGKAFGCTRENVRHILDYGLRDVREGTVGDEREYYETLAAETA